MLGHSGRRATPEPTTRSTICSLVDERRRRPSRRISASFTETTVSSLLRDPLVATGTLVATLPLRVVMSYTSPTVKTVALDDTRLVVAVAGVAAREELNIAETQRRVQKYFVRRLAEAAARDCSRSRLSSDPKVTTRYRLDMVPRASRSPRASIACGSGSIATGCVMIKMALDYPGGDSKTLELRDIRTNVAIDESAFASARRRQRR